MALERKVTNVKCLPRARTTDIRSYLKLLAKDTDSMIFIVIHAGSNDTWSHQSEVTKLSGPYRYIIFSGLLPDWTSDDMFSHMLSFHQQLSRWYITKHVITGEHFREPWSDLERRHSSHFG